MNEKYPSQCVGKVAETSTIIPEIVECMQKNLTDLHTQINQLENRLQYVSEPEPSGLCNPSAPMPPPNNLAERLRDKNRGISEATNRINAMIRGLQF